jgi:lipoprotein-releasing system permease protein
MYKLHLIRKYLLKRRIAWVALVAVTLCTAMVLVVVSVMGGWLRMFEDSFHGMTGDVVISSTSLGGFPYYQEMIDNIRKLPDAVAAVPVIRTGALINIDNRDVAMVQVLGYPPDIDTVDDWGSSLHLKQKNPFALHPDIRYENYVSDRARANARNRPGMIISSLVVGMRKDKGPEADDFRDQFYRFPVTLTLVPVVGGEQISPESATTAGFWIVDDSHSRLWQLDNNNVYISFDEAQRDLLMAATPAKPATDTDLAQEAIPARCSEVQIKAKPGADLNVLRNEVQKITDQIRLSRGIPPWYDFKVQTWIEQQGAIIKAVQNEVVLTTALFGIISMVAVLLIFCIFYMIVVEKTKDIGIIKSVGATGAGILSLFLGYGLFIGLIGASMGFGVAYIIVKYINEIHAWLGRAMGIVIWSPETYQFDRIPSQMETTTVVRVLVVAVLAAVLGALVPAIRAAMMNPVDSLRYE